MMSEQHDFEVYLQDMNQWANLVQTNWSQSAAFVTEKADDDRIKEWEAKVRQFSEDVRALQQSRSSYDERYAAVQNIKQESINIFNEYLSMFRENEGEFPEGEQHERNSNGDLTNMQGRVPPGGHRLPPLPYQYDALEPYISEQIMRLHHDKHHKGYVEGLNKAENMMQQARRSGNYELLRHWEREAAFNGAGHYLHTIFWNVMSPAGGGRPSGALARQIDLDFGSFQAFKKHFSEAAKKVEAVGWAILVWAPRAHRLEILQAEKHQNLSQWDVIPLLVLDVWEHAYYLQYQTDRGKYVDNWWNIVNWRGVEKRFQEASKVRWQPY